MTQKPPTGAPRLAKPAEQHTGASPLELLRFLLRAAKQHALAGFAVFALAAGVGVAAVIGIPSLYECTAKIYATQNTAITSALASGRHSEEGAQLKGLNETVYNRENLRAMVREAKLVENWDTTRTWPLRLKDRLQVALLGPLKRADQERTLIDMLARAIAVGAEDSASIRFRVQWRDRAAALQLTELVQRNFLSARGAEEVAAIRRAIEVLEAELARADTTIDPAIKEVQRLVAKAREASGEPRKPGAVRLARPAASALALAPTPPGELTAKLQELRRAQRDLLEPWQRRNADLKFQLTELRATYGPDHPLVRAQEAKLQAAGEQPPELAPMRREEAELLASLADIGSAVPVHEPRRALGEPAGVGGAASLRNLLERGPEDPEVATARSRLEAALGKSKELSERLDAARIELATAQAGFKYRYVVVEAAELPRKPLKPKRPLLFALAFVVALALGILTGAARELLTGKLVDAWQVRGLGLDILGEVELHDGAGKS